MHSKLFVVLVALSGAGVFCLHYDQKQIFEEVDFQGKAKADELLTKLNSDEGPLTSEQVHYLLGGFFRCDKIGTYLVPQYRAMARISTEKCLRDNLTRHQTICNRTTIASLKRYCQFCLDQLLEFCGENKEAVLSLFWLSIGSQLDRAAREIQLVNSGFNRFITANKLEAGNSIEGNLATFIKTEDQFHELIPLKNIRQRCKLLVKVAHEHLAHLGLSTAEVIKIVETKFKVALEGPVKFCKLLIRASEN